MKKIGLVTSMITLIILVFGACEESELPTDQAIEGTYVGTFTSIDSQKSKADEKATEDAIAEITKIGNLMIEVHLYNTELDTTFVLNYFNDMNIVRVCFTGDDFENAYGYRLRQEHISRGMIGHIQNNETEWMHHLNDEHQEAEEHFGEFNMENHTFSYPFYRMEGGLTQNLLFQGKKL